MTYECMYCGRPTKPTDRAVSENVTSHGICHACLQANPMLRRGKTETVRRARRRVPACQWRMGL